MTGPWAQRAAAGPTPRPPRARQGRRLPGQQPLSLAWSVRGAVVSFSQAEDAGATPRDHGRLSGDWVLRGRSLDRGRLSGNLK